MRSHYLLPMSILTSSDMSPDIWADWYKSIFHPYQLLLYCLWIHLFEWIFTHHFFHIVFFTLDCFPNFIWFSFLNCILSCLCFCFYGRDLDFVDDRWKYERSLYGRLPRKSERLYRGFRPCWNYKHNSYRLLEGI